MKNSKARYQKYKILHLTTGLYVHVSFIDNSPWYDLVDIPSIFKYKIPYKSMCIRRITKVIKDIKISYKIKYDINEFEIIEIED
jgi:hypothetical protein